MSLQYVIDGYNITNHPAFKQKNSKSYNCQEALIKLIRIKKLCGKNKATIVFDGYPHEPGFSGGEDIDVIFSRKESADEKIKRIVESYGNPRNIVVVSDDNEVRFFAKSAGAKPMSVEKFINPQVRTQSKKEAFAETELTYGQREKSNKELRKIWLE